MPPTPLAMLAVKYVAPIAKASAAAAGRLLASAKLLKGLKTSGAAFKGVGAVAARSLRLASWAQYSAKTSVFWRYKAVYEAEIERRHALVVAYKQSGDLEHALGVYEERRARADTSFMQWRHLHAAVQDGGAAKAADEKAADAALLTEAAAKARAVAKGVLAKKPTLAAALAEGAATAGGLTLGDSPLDDYNDAVCPKRRRRDETLASLAWWAVKLSPPLWSKAVAKAVGVRGEADAVTPHRYAFLKADGARRAFWHLFFSTLGVVALVLVTCRERQTEHFLDDELGGHMRTVTLSRKQERELGRLLSDEMRAEHQERIDSPEGSLHQAVWRVAERLLASIPENSLPADGCVTCEGGAPPPVGVPPDNPKQIQWSLCVHFNPEKNAMVSPDGLITMYTGMLEFCRTEDEVAAVLAHEMAHVLLRHSVSSEGHAEVLEVGKSFVTGIAWMTGLMSYYTTHWMTSAIQDYALLKPMSREHEDEADRYGLRLMAKAGYDPMAPAKVWARFMDARSGRVNAGENIDPGPFEKMIANELKGLPAPTGASTATGGAPAPSPATMSSIAHEINNARASEFFSTHPSDPRRVESLLKLGLRVRGHPDYAAARPAGQRRWFSARAATPVERWCYVLRQGGGDVYHGLPPYPKSKPSAIGL
eukprot:TRINITY_DN10099_c0_g1_i1.p1 TRINITY_DN10099_c0_g1~~TRINITY_DN10099_c0_g1_i1.p1  ORF type:complete len:669 (+),score=199.29 TRINITY_DN10099_c0_g1_i1:56-2008(+)